MNFNKFMADKKEKEYQEKEMQAKKQKEMENAEMMAYLKAEQEKAEYIVNEKRHLQHPFYKKVDKVTAKVAHDQIIKGSQKYKEPFNPGSWTNRDLVEHQLQELRDAQVYGVGLLERLDEQEAKIKRLGAQIEQLANYLLKNHNDAITEGSAVDVAIKVLMEQEEEIEKGNHAIIENREWKKEVEFLKNQSEYWRQRLIKEVETKGGEIDERV